MTETVTYRNINAIVRPYRCAIFINEKSQYWRVAVRGAITAASEVWGGRSFLIIPTDGTRVDPNFWRLLEAYSPDHLATYNLTFADFSHADPTEYQRVRSEYHAKWLEQGNSPSDFDSWFDRSAQETAIDRFAINSDLADELLDRLSPFHFQGSIINQHLSQRAGFGFPFSKVPGLIPYAKDTVDSVLMPEPTGDRDLDLLLYSQAGLPSDKYSDELTAVSVRKDNVPSTQLIDLVAHLLGSRPIRTADRKNTCFQLTMIGLSEYYDRRLHLEYKEPVVIIVGNEPQDFCFYYSLSRLHSRVCWLPLNRLRETSQFLRRNEARHLRGDSTEPIEPRHQFIIRLVSLFYELIDFGNGEKEICLCSISLGARQLGAYRRQVVDCSLVDRRGFASKVRHTSLTEVSTSCVMKVFEDDNYVNNNSVIFVNGESVSPLVTPRPRNFSAIQPSGHWWVTALEIENYTPPPLPGLSTPAVDRDLGCGGWTRSGHRLIIAGCVDS